MEKLNILLVGGLITVEHQGRKITARLRELLEALDHQFLNELAPFSDNYNPTAEHLAEYIYNEMSKAEFFNDNVKLKHIQVWESPKSSVIYTLD